MDKIFNETKLLELSDKANINALKDHRNLSAHPNILDTEDNVLFTPNKDTVRAHIRNMLEGVLAKASMHTAKLVDVIITKIPEIYEMADEEKEYERIVVKRYIGGINEKALSSLFRKLWKFTYRLDDEDCQENRDVNGLTLQIIHRMYPDFVAKWVSEDRDYFSQVSIESDQLTKMIDLFNQAPRLFFMLDEDTQKQIEAEVKKKTSKYIRAWFLSSSPDDHLKNVTQYLTKRGKSFTPLALQSIEELANAANNMDEYRKMLILYFSYSSSYADTYDRFKRIRRKLESLNEEQFIELLKVMNSNSQIYNAGGCSGLLEEIQEAAENSLGTRIDIIPYKNLK